MAKRVGLRLRKPGKRKLDIEESTLRRLIKEGKTMTEIAGIFDCAISTISQRVRRYGLKNIRKEA